ncbi:relaxase/mobilization nuclease domain-containing protein [Enterococcus faecium]|uniref:MobA/VirD2-like nuclease domain-containing protein n=1 Tax=Enterococcus faecium TaxID=1352 RepID=A0A242AMV2_ENTFC|nr:relaxase/mobilization nuclease domain-containing protein [Enterococcus faecium]OTN82249.1 hypothetical protein A5810_003216 [Enterococcus faecium]
MATVKVSTTISCSRAINYAEKRAEVKDAYNCEITNAKQEMAMVREMYAKTDGIQAHLIIQAFSPEESAQLGAEKINQLGIELAQAIAPDHQIAVYTHVDRKHYHNHIVINSVNIKTGKKYHQHNEFKYVKARNDKLLKKHGLAIVQPQKHYEKITSPELQLRRRGATPWKDDIRRKIDAVMQDKSISSYNAFREVLARSGIKLLESKKNVSYDLLEVNKRVSGRKLGSSYEKETIQRELEARAKKQEKRTRQALQNQHKSLPLVSNANRQQKQQQQRQKRHICHVRERLRQNAVTLCTDKHMRWFKAQKALEPSSVVTYYAPPQKRQQFAKKQTRGRSFSR